MCIIHTHFAAIANKKTAEHPHQSDRQVRVVYNYYFMKQLLYILLSIVLLSSCKKTEQIDIPISKEVTMANDPDFIDLMDAINRFDPLYVDIVFRKKSGNQTSYTKEVSHKLSEVISEEAYINNCDLRYNACLLNK